jgi:hypothetical protein
MFVDNRETFEAFRIEFTGIRSLDEDWLLAIGILHVRARGSGIETDLPTAGIRTERNGLMIDWKDYGDPAKALDAAGLSE